MKTSDNGINLLIDFEGVELKAYPDSGGIWTIGIGTTVVNGVPVKQGDICTLSQAKDYMKKDLVWFETQLNNRLKVPVNQNQFDALILLWYNTGGSNTIVSMINSRTDLDIISQWWQTHYITAKGKVLRGLIMRRQKEAKLFTS